MVKIFEDQLATAVASDTWAGWATTLEEHRNEITKVLSHYNITGLQYGSNQGLIEGLGPAIDDELAAGYAAKFLDARYEAPFSKSHTRATLSARDVAPVFDSESIQATFNTLGPAIHEPITI